MIRQYDPQTWVDDDGSGTTGTTLSKSRMDTIENAAAELSRRTRVVRAATTANITISAPGASIDGVALASGDRVLLAGQASAAQNGVYLFSASGAALRRAADFAASGQVQQGQVIVPASGSLIAAPFVVVTDQPLVGSAAIVIASHIPQRVTSLPALPYDGQEIFYVADATKGVIWHLRYNAGSASIYKWEFVGGSRLAAEGIGGRDWNTVETTTALNYGTLTTPGPSLTGPLAGEYDVEGQATASHVTANNLAGILLWVTGDGTPAWNTGDGVATVGAALAGSTVRASRLRTLVAGNTVELRYASSTASSAARFYNRSLYLRPVRVG